MKFLSVHIERYVCNYWYQEISSSIQAQLIEQVAINIKKFWAQYKAWLNRPTK